ncbi:unnamed protein product [Strongylus vulgaris]|uniref:Uncharacterized protein n=1 Tax=Strongylus vulgaris TaxID=40348 RepID=A0A3P7HW27_STRVU|nr:unnamed protein product [Strongylus vulgaris]
MYKQANRHSENHKYNRIGYNSLSFSRFTIWNIVFLIVRLASSVLTVMTFWYGLRQSETAYIDITSGNYNTTYVRLNCLLAVLSLQLFQLWNFTSFHIGRFKCVL